MREWRGLNSAAFNGDQRHAVEAANLQLHELTAAVKRLGAGQFPGGGGGDIFINAGTPLPFIYITEADHLANAGAIQAALNSFVGGGVVRLGPGSFHLLAGLTVPLGVTLEGAGPFVTYLWYTANPNLDIITLAASYTTVANVSVRGVDPAIAYGNGYGAAGTGRGIVIAAPSSGSGSLTPVYFPTLRNVEVANTPSWCVYDTGIRQLTNLGTGVSPAINYELPAVGVGYTSKCLSVGLTLDNVQLAFPNSGGALYIGYGATVPKVSRLLTNSYSFNTITIAGVQENLGAVQLYNVTDGTFDGKCTFQSPSAQGGGVPVVHADTDATMLGLLLSTTINFEAPYFEVLSANCAGGPGRTHWFVSTINSNWVMEQPYGLSAVYDLATGNGYPLRIVHSPAGGTIGSGITLRDGNFYHYRETYAAGTQPRYLANGSPSVLDRDDIALEGALEAGAVVENCTVVNYTTGIPRDFSTPASPDAGYLLPTRAGASFTNSNGILQLAAFDDCNLSTPVNYSDLRLRWSRYHEYAAGVLGYSRGRGSHDVSCALVSTVNVTSTTAGQLDAVEVGNVATGAHIPAGTYVTAKASNSAITLSAAATGTLTETLTFYGNGTFQREGLWACSYRSGPDFRQIPYIRMAPSIWPGVQPGDLWMVLGSPVSSVYTTARFFWHDGTAWQTQIDRSIGTAAGDLIKYTASDTPARLAIGSTGDVLTVAGGLPTWAAITQDFADSTFRLHDNGDPSKKLAFECSTIATTTTRTLTIPNASGVIALDPTAATGDMLYRASSGQLAAVGIGSAGQFLGTAAGTLPTWSNPVLRDDLLQITNNIGTRTLLLDTAGIGTSSTRTLSVQDVSAATVVVGKVSGTTATSGTLGRQSMPNRTGNVAAQTLLTGNTTSAGLYRMTFYLKTTTAGTPGVAVVKVTVAWNDGTAQTLDVPFENGTVIFNNLDLGTLNAFAQGDLVVSAAASTNISFTTTGTYTGSPQYSIEARIEALG